MTTENATLQIEEPKTKTAKKKAKKKKPFVPNKKFNRQLFKNDILAKMKKDELSYRDVQTAVKLNVAIIHRAIRKEGINIDSVVPITNWLQKPISTYFQ